MGVFQLSKKSVYIGALGIGGNFPVRVESMLRTPLADIKACMTELTGLEREGCELVRVAFPDPGSAKNLSRLISLSTVEIMADIHFDHRLAIGAIDAGCRSIRINPGNMGGRKKLKELSDLVVEREVLVRIGANAGSLSSSQVERAGRDIAKALSDTVSEQVFALQDNGVDRIIISAKSSSPQVTLKANTFLASKFQYPIHAGLTEAGPTERGIIKSSVALGTLLGAGIGDTIRVSLTGRATDEVKAGKRILQALGIRRFEPELISCPACGRRRVDVAFLVELIEPLLKELSPETTVAVMGCEVNGPREAAGADIGVAGTPAGIMLFSRGESRGVCRLEDLSETFLSLCREGGLLR